MSLSVNQPFVFPYPDNMQIGLSIEYSGSGWCKCVKIFVSSVLSVDSWKYEIKWRHKKLNTSSPQQQRKRSDDIVSHFILIASIVRSFSKLILLLSLPFLFPSAVLFSTKIQFGFLMPSFESHGYFNSPKNHAVMGNEDIIMK